MRVGFLVDSFPTVSETFIIQQIAAVLSAGHQVRIFADRAAHDGPVQAEVERFGMTGMARWLATAPTAPGGRIAALLTLVRAHPMVAGPLICAAGRDGLLWLIAAANRCRIVLGSDPVDIFVCHYGHNGATVALMKRLGLLRARLVTFVHGYDLPFCLERRHRLHYRLLDAGADLILTVNRKQRRRLLALGLAPDRTFVHHMSVDTSAFDPSCRVPSREGTLRILSVARLVGKKGIAYAVRAVSVLVRRGCRISYVIAGDGPLREKLDDLVRRLDIADHVSFVGWQDAEGIRRLLSRSDVYLAPSVTPASGDQEGIPVSIMEAMACGLPVVASDHGGIGELVIDGETGFLAPERDVDALAARIGRLADDPALGRMLGRRGRDVVRRSFDSGVQQRRFIALLEALG